MPWNDKHYKLNNVVEIVKICQKYGEYGSMQQINVQILCTCTSSPLHNFFNVCTFICYIDPYSPYFLAYFHYLHYIIEFVVFIIPRHVVTQLDFLPYSLLLFIFPFPPFLYFPPFVLAYFLHFFISSFFFFFFSLFSNSGGDGLASIIEEVAVCYRTSPR